MKYAFIRAHCDEFSVRAMCRVLRVHFSGFYAWLNEPSNRRTQESVYKSRSTSVQPALRPKLQATEN